MSLVGQLAGTRDIASTGHGHTTASYSGSVVPGRLRGAFGLTSPVLSVRAQRFRDSDRMVVGLDIVIFSRANRLVRSSEI